mmetsp:Transcript_22526/g.21677  ORF Transcript_22526/g.21677 Transcript_22526/m.21677 type:complete len:110 (+) Transcript_22526:461-790(+)
MHFIELYSFASPSKLQYEEDVIKYAFKCISGGQASFNFNQFMIARANNPELFAWLEQPGKYFKDFQQESGMKQQKIDFSALENFYQFTMEIFDDLIKDVSAVLGIEVEE